MATIPQAIQAEPSEENTRPVGYQLVPARGRTNTPPWKRAVSIDPSRKTTEVLNKSDLKEGYTPLKSKRRASQLTIFVDWLSGEPTTSISGNDPCGNDMVATFDLEKLPFNMWETIHRKLGGRSTLYVRNLDSFDGRLE